MKSWNAFTTGITIVWQYKRALFLVYLISLLLAFLPGMFLASQIEASLGNSLAGKRMAEGYDALWYKQFSAAAQGIARTFQPSVVEAGALFDALDSFITGKILSGQSGIVYMAAIYWLMWIFLSAGFINLFLSKTGHLFEGASRFFFRFLMLGIIAAVAYWLVFRYLLTWLNGLTATLTRNTIDERVAFFYTVGKYLLVWMGIYFINIIVDYSKIFVVSREYKNVFKGIATAAVFIGKQPGAVIALYLFTGTLWVLLAFGYTLIAPGAGQSTWMGVFGAFVIGQLYILTRIGVRCLFYAGEAALAASSAEETHNSAPDSISG